MYVSRHRALLWASLQSGHFVAFSRQGLNCHQGYVDDRTDDGLIVWVTDETGHRRLFHVEDDYDVAVWGAVPAAG
ncbi:hypothetical protein AAIH32_10230 [Pseudarthrobacter oxydans]|uniref:hypothetical protein n=1 Tax=Pseudarthrobacter oxydans TaxID=1671 RepID=UPI003D2D1665